MKNVGERTAFDVPYLERTSTQLRVLAERLEYPWRRSAPKQREPGGETNRERYQRDGYSLNAKQ